MFHLRLTESQTQDGAKLMLVKSRLLIGDQFGPQIRTVTSTSNFFKGNIRYLWFAERTLLLFCQGKNLRPWARIVRSLLERPKRFIWASIVCYKGWKIFTQSKKSPMKRPKLLKTVEKAEKIENQVIQEHEVLSEQVIKADKPSTKGWKHVI